MKSVSDRSNVFGKVKSLLSKALDGMFKILIKEIYETQINIYNIKK